MMTEALLQYLWNYKKFTNLDFVTTQGQPIEVLDFGRWNHNSGPDFSMGKIKYNGITMVGNIELHVRSSDWFLHEHAANPEFRNIILHVVYFDDVAIPELQERNTPTLALKNYISPQLLWRYSTLQLEEEFIACEKVFGSEAIPFHFAEESLLKKLHLKAEHYQQLLQQNKNNFEALLFQQLAYAFGLKVNAYIFEQLASSLPFSVILKTRQNLIQLEALFFGKCGWLENPQDDKTKIWATEYQYLSKKFNLPHWVLHPKFSRLRPPNFPSIRLAQLAMLYHKTPNIFDILIREGQLKRIYKTLKSVQADVYWDTHFKLGKVAEKHFPKKLSKDFINLLLYNCILPLQYYFRMQHEPEAADEILNHYRQLSPEKNSVISQWKSLGVNFENALHSQAFLYHYQNFCQKKRCLDCGIGYQILKNTRTND